MFKTLRNRLILSHVLPIMFVIPLMGVAIVYAIETQYLLPSISKDMTGDARLLIAFAREQKGVFDNALNAQAFLSKFETDPGKRIMLLSAGGRLLASSDPGDAGQINQDLQISGLQGIEKGQFVERIDYSQRLRGEVVDVFAPVMNADQSLAGIVRISYRFVTVTDELFRLRYLITGILAFGLLTGAVLAFLLALNISNPIRQATQAIYDLASGNRRETLAERGPDELRMLNNAVNTLVERLHNLEQSRRQLLSNLVHELGRPLGALRMAIHAARRGAKQDPQLLDELLLGMDEETAMLQRLLDDLAHLHEQVLGTLELDRQTVDLKQWLPTILLPWKEAALDKRLKWEESVPPDLPAISADPVRLGQIIGNLTSNAIKYTPMGGVVSVSAGATEAEIWVCVADTGPGIAPEEQEKIFTPFYRGDQARRFKQGMGLGLAIARDLATAHGGRLELESVPGLGSQFKVRIPIQQKA